MVGGGSNAGEVATSVSIATNKGQAIRVDFVLEQLVALKHETTAAWRIEPTISLEYDYDESGAPPLLTEQDRALIDQAAFDFAAALIAEGRAQPAVILPISFFTVAARKGRHALTMIAAAQALKAGLVVEFVDVDRGTPISRLTEVGGLLTSICRAVFVRLQPAIDMLAPVRGYRPHGLTLDGADLASVDSQIAKQLLSFGDQAKGAAPLLIAQGLPNDGFFQVAKVAGMTHASVRPGAEPAQRTAA
jgi:hypothetical protein